MTAELQGLKDFGSQRSPSFSRRGLGGGSSVRASAPVRICDIGGWTDTWFAEYGAVFNIAVDPGIVVEIESSPVADKIPAITIESGQLGTLRVPRGAEVSDEQFRLPFIVAKEMAQQTDLDIRICIASEIPAGSALGTSASLCVALVAALSAMHGSTRSQVEVAAHAQEIESTFRQTGVQDQYAAALGGINFIEIVKYPEVRIERLTPEKKILDELEERLLLFWLGSAHASTQLHEMVIQNLQGQGPECVQLQNLRDTAAAARTALLAGDFKSFGVAMSDNTLAQAELHPDLVSLKALSVIRCAASHRALGWKVNGAGGEGGSLTILAPANPPEKHQLISAIESSVPGVKNIPIKFNYTGVAVG